MNGLVVVANRLPVQAPAWPRGEWTTAPGGLVSALTDVLEQEGGTWVGWAGSDRAPAPPRIGGIRLRAVPLSGEEVRDHYDGFANATLWPLYHRLVVPPVFRSAWWEAYERVNRRFADAASAAAPRGGFVWVHDYHLQLVPALLRARRPDLRIGFFSHVPFPAPEIFAQLPWRRQVLEGILGAHVIGFQTHLDASNFRAAVTRWAGDDHAGAQIGAFPISVDFARWSRIACAPETERQAERWRAELGGPRTVLLGIDRLDYTKGIDLRLSAFRDLLRDGRVRAPETVLVQVATPTRDRTASYRRLRERVERLVGEINGDFGRLGAPAVHYIHRALAPEELPALYRCADVMLVTSIQDGMNLVAKEFVSSRVACRGVLVLSEFAGASSELTDAVIVNPHDAEALQQAIIDAMQMHPDEVRRRMASLRSVVDDHDIQSWASSFLSALGSRPRPHPPASPARDRHPEERVLATLG